MADNEFSQHHPGSGPSPQGRSIGGVRDQSAPTVGGGPTSWMAGLCRETS
ncbi:MAG: hypothetical protein ACJ788_10355 [Ktedonobacteraceae bacterium]